MKGRTHTLYIIIFCMYLAAVGLLCFIKPSSLPEMDIKTFFGLPLDKVLHFLMFLPYPFLSGMIFLSKEQRPIVSCVILFILAVTGIGVAYGTEIIQSYTGYRSYEIADFHADMIGIAAGTLLAAAYMTYTRLKK